MFTDTDKVIFSNADDKFKAFYESVIKKGMFYNEEKVYNTGYIYLKHKQEPQKALPWLIISARNNNSNAQYHLGYMYEKGKGVAKDELAAFEWHLKAANNKNKASWFYIGNAFYQGRKDGIPENCHRAMEWFFKYDGHMMNKVKIKSGCGLSKEDKSKSVTQLVREAQAILNLEYEKIKKAEYESRKEENDTRRSKKSKENNSKFHKSKVKRSYQ